MSGWSLIVELRRLEAEVDKFGFKFAKPKFGDIADNRIALIPKDNDSLPVYSRDAELFLGTLTELQHWLRGADWARTYDALLKLSDSTKRERKEQDERNHQLVKILKNEKRELAK